MKPNPLHYIRALLDQPTAPFCEDSVRAEVIRHLSQFKHVTWMVDSLGNILATYRNEVAHPRWLLSAHMDHPGFVGGEFLGGVPAAVLAKQFPRKDFGKFAMWDLPATEIRGGFIHSRACDDLVGCGAILSTFAQLEYTSAKACLMGAFTCAEEVGLLGAVHICRSGVLPREIGIISVETSAVRAPAKMHHGVIIRAGDKSSTFDSDLVSELTDVAVAQGIPFQRCLMSGGTCEATAYRLYGYRVAGACVALGNYHNCNPAGGVAPEYVSIKDVEALVKLCSALATRLVPSGGARLLRDRLERRLDEEILKRFS
ncbi:MAG: hypothetical protein RLZZ399_1852 [Verrucomicrobiota bacterium]|jgi:endoglucanase